MSKRVILKSDNERINDIINSDELFINFGYIKNEDKYINRIYNYFNQTEQHLLKSYSTLHFYLKNSEYINKYFDLLFLLSEKYNKIDILNLEQFNFTSETIIKLCDFLKLNKLELLQLNIFEISNENLELLAETLRNNLSIKKLILDYGRLNNDHYHILTEQLKYNKSINELVIEFSTYSYNNKYLYYISELLKCNTNIHNLIVKHTFENKELVYLSEILKFSTIQYLKLYNCEINDEQFDIFYNSLKNNKTLLKLDLSWNNLTNKSYLKILEFLKNNKTLISLNLNGDKNKDIILFTEKLKEVMKTNITLQVLKIGDDFFQKRDNHINSINSLSEMLKNNKTLNKIKLPHHILNNKKYEKILTEIINNKPDLKFYC